MNRLTQAIYDVLVGDATLTGMLGTYQGTPAIFTIDPAPGDATLPYLVTAGQVADVPFDTKTTLGREITRDVRCYTEASGSAALVERIAERVRTLLHRRTMVIDGWAWVLGDCSGPIAADEADAYARIITVRLIVEEI